jgi:hypothetical protein
MNDDLIILIALLVICIPLLLVGIAAVLFLRIQRKRRMNRQAVRPRLLPTAADQMPEGYRVLLGQLTHAFLQLGFTAVANVYSPDFGANRQWLQVVFARRETCDRFSCLCPIYARHGVVTYIFSTTASDGVEVKTTVGPSNSSTADFKTNLPLTSSQAISAAYQAHRARVAAQLQGKTLIPTPPEGNEVPWLAAKLAKVTKSMAEKKRFTLSFDRQWYVPAWKPAFAMAVESFFRKKESRGFAVMPTDPTDASQSDPLKSADSWSMHSDNRT